MPPNEAVKINDIPVLLGAGVVSVAAGVDVIVNELNEVDPAGIGVIVQITEPG